jgi:hypothetical protein
MSCLINFIEEFKGILRYSMPICLNAGSSTPKEPSKTNTAEKCDAIFSVRNFNPNLPEQLPIIIDYLVCQG